MHDVEDEPLLWLIELTMGLSVLFMIQLLCGVITHLAILSHLTHSQKLHTSLGLIFILSFLSRGIFNAKSHLVGRIVGAVAMVFTTPLQAVACIENAASQKQETRANDVILRVAIPAALPSKRYCNEHPRVQVIRGTLYLTLAASMRGYFEASIQAGGIFMDAMALLFMIGGAAGALNLMSALLGFLGIRSPSPFRKPLLATSLASFWGGRWNAPVSDALRVGLYRPLLRRGVSTALATMACFVCSAVAHEVILVYCGFLNSHGEWFWFFTIAGVMTVLEKAAKEFVPKRARWFVCFLALYVPFHFLFVPMTVRTGLAHAGVRSIAAGNVLLRNLWKQLTAET